MRHRCKQAQETTGSPVAQLLFSPSAGITPADHSALHPKSCYYAEVKSANQRMIVHVNGSEGGERSALTF